MKVGSRPIIFATVAVAIVSAIGVGVSATGAPSTPRPAAVAASAPVETPAFHAPRKPAAVMTGHQLALAAGFAQAAGGPKPQMVDSVFKNIQVLKDTTVDDFMGTMGLMSAALGFCCNDCHEGAGTDKVKWEDDNVKKRTARKMVTMVQTLNKTSFNGRQVVTCWTCHRGRDMPVMTPGLDAVYSEPRVELDDILARAPGVPAADVVLGKYMAALGGAQKVAAVTSYSAKGKSVGFGGFGGGGQVEIFAKAPDMHAVYIHFPDDPDRGDSTRTFNGKTGWIATPLAVVRKYELTGGELDGARLDAQLAFPSEITKALTNLRVGPPTQIGDKDYEVVQGNGQKGSVATLYFDRQTGLLARVVRFTPSPIGKVPTQVDYSDYRDVNGVKFPYKITFSWLDGRDTIEVSEVKTNVAIDASQFGEPNPLKK